MDVIKLYKSKLNATQLIIGSLLFVITCVYFIINERAPHEKGFEWFGLCFFGFGTFWGFLSLLDPRPQVIIDESGIYFLNGPKNPINWELIKSAYYKEYDSSLLYGAKLKQKYICLTFDPKDLALFNVSKRILKLQRVLGYEGIGIYLNPLQKVDGEKFAELIKAMAQSDILARKKLLQTFNQ